MSEELRSYWVMVDGSANSGTRASLLVRIRDPQDSEAWHTFAGIYTPIVYSYCRHNGLQEMEAADVAQEVLAHVLESIKQFEYDPERELFRDWLGTATRRELARHIRKCERLQSNGSVTQVLARIESADPDPDWIDQFHGHVLETALERVRSDFEPAVWQAFDRVWLGGVPAAQIATELDEPIEKIYLAKSRVLKRLRQEINAVAEEIPLPALRQRGET